MTTQRDERVQRGRSAYRTVRTVRKRRWLVRLVFMGGGGVFVALLGLPILGLFGVGSAIVAAEEEGLLDARCATPEQQPQAPAEESGPGLPLTEEYTPSFVFDSRNIARVAANAGFEGEDLVTAVAVARAESVGNPSAINTVNDNGTTDYGLWQINSVHIGSGFDPARSRDPAYNATWAYRIYEAAGRRWSPWVAYTNGKYRDHLPAARAAVENPDTVAVDDLPRDGGGGLTETADCSSGMPVTLTTAEGSDRTRSISARAGAAIAFARQQIGDPYEWAAMGPDRWDCSSLVQAAWATAGVTLPRVSRVQHAAVTPVPKFDIHPGDLIFYGDPVYHVAMYTGNGMMIEAPQAGLRVRELPVRWDDFRGVGRPAP